MESLIKSFKRIPIRILSIAGVIFGLIYFCISCDLGTEQDETISFYEDIDQSITKYIESNSDRFSILLDILETTGLNHLFKTYGDYTFLAPTDSAFNLYFQEKGISSYTDIPTDELTSLVKYHVFNTPIVSGGFNMGIIEAKTLSGHYMVSGPTEDGSDVRLNKHATIILKDVVLPNGLVHEIDRVLDIPTASIYDWLTEHQADYSIFLEALDQTGYDQVAKNSIGDPDAFYSIFITSDSKFAENNIHSFSDLAELVSPDENDYTDSTNLLRAYMGSHFALEVLSTSDATEDQSFIGTAGGATIKYGLKPASAEVVLQYKTGDFPEGLDVDEYGSNNLVANGVLHVMDTMYMVTSSFSRFNNLFIWMDVPTFPYDSIYWVGVDAYVSNIWDDNLHRYFPREGVSKYLDWEALDGWITLNAPHSGFVKFDHHRAKSWDQPLEEMYGLGQPGFLGFDVCDDLLDITRKLPYVIPGKYRLYHVVKVGPHRPSVIHYFNGKQVGGIFNLTLGIDFQSLYLGTVDIKEGETEHFLRVKSVTKGFGFYVAIKLEPVY